MTLRQAEDLVKQLGYARLTEQRARQLHPNEAVPRKPRAVHLPRSWQGREAELHVVLNDSVIPVLKAAIAESKVLADREALDLMVKFAKKVKCRIKPRISEPGVMAQEDAA